MKRYIIALAAFVALALSCSKIEHGPKKEVIPDKCEYELAYSTEIVPESTAATIVAGSGPYGSFTVKDTPENDIWGRNRFFILPSCDAYPNGLCAKINGRQTNPDGTSTIRYAECALENVFQNLDLQACGDLVPHVDRILDGSGEEIPFKLTKAIGKDRFVIELPQARLRNWDETVIFQINKGKLELDMLLSVVINDAKLRYFGAKLNPTIDLDIDMEANVQKSFVDKSHPFMTIICGAFPAGPVVITPLIEISFIVGAKGKVALTAGLKYKQECKITAICDDGEFECNLETIPHETKEDVLTFKNTTYYTEADIYAGFDYSGGIGVFGTVLYATVGVQEKIKCGGKFVVDLDKWTSDAYNSIPELFDTYSESMFYVDYAYNGVAALKTVGGTSLGSFKGSEVSEHIDSAYFMPKVEVALKNKSDKSETLEFTATRKTLWPYEIGYYFVQLHPGDPYYSSLCENDLYYDKKFQERVSLGKFDLPAGKEFTKYIEEVYPDENAKCLIWPFFSHAGKDYPFPSSYCLYFAHDGKALKAFKEIVNDLAQCIEGDLPEHWNTSTPLSRWVGVTISSKDNIPYMQIDLKDRSSVFPGDETGTKYTINLKPTLRIGDHSGGQNYLWEIIDIPEDITLEMIDIEDRNFMGYKCYNPIRYSYGASSQIPVTYSNQIKNIKIWSDKLEEFHMTSRTESVELKGQCAGYDERHKGIKQFGFSSMLTENLKSVTLEGLSVLTDFGLGGDSNFVNGSPDVKISECPALEALYLRQPVQSAETILSNLSKNKLTNLLLRNMSISALNRDKPSGDIDLDNCEIGSIDLSGDCTNLSVQNGTTIGSVKITNCPSLEKLNLMDCKMTSFSIDDMPSAKFFDISGAHINSEIPPVFDKIRALAVNGFHYDQKYYYYSKYDYSEGKYGWWYPGEPDRGYHLTPIE